MKYLDFYNKLNSMEDDEYIENYLLYNTSLVIAGAKPAVTITIKKNNHKLYNSWTKFGKSFIDIINLEYTELRENMEYIILMIYDRRALNKNLNIKENKEFLINLGYKENFIIDDCIENLKNRYDKYHCPHELGLFLGIPFEDVKDFMECTEKKCLLCGYWKVYNNTMEAKKIFDKYDEIKEYTIKNILKGNNSSHSLIVSIKDSFYNNAQYI
jgi:hypothetical protein